MDTLWVAGGVIGVIILGLWTVGAIRMRLGAIEGMHCPNCGGHRFVRVHRSWGNRLFGMGLRRYRCLDCQWEGLRKRHA